VRSIVSRLQRIDLWGTGMMPALRDHRGRGGRVLPGASVAPTHPLARPTVTPRAGAVRVLPGAVHKLQRLDTP